MCHGFQITYFNIQQLSIVLMTALLEHFNLEVNEKVSFRSSDTKLGILFLTNISLALLPRETCKILRYTSLSATRILDIVDLLNYVHK